MQRAGRQGDVALPAMVELFGSRRGAAAVPGSVWKSCWQHVDAAVSSAAVTSQRSCSAVISIEAKQKERLKSVLVSCWSPLNCCFLLHLAKDLLQW